MEVQNQPIETLEEIKRIMERSSRFISLSGWSGISAGVCALIAAFVTARRIDCWKIGDCLFSKLAGYGAENLKKELILIGAATFLVSFILAFIFTWLRSRKNNSPIWNGTVRRLMWSVMGPLIAGGLFLYRMIQLHQFELVAPGCLIFYGLALINASKYTLGEIRYLGYGQLLLGLLNLWLIGYGLHFWALGFGVLHILYGIVMWYKYER
ncbi:MAG TPA: hypothetical protein VM012_10855 [Flavitalea sp.]|nr:hypothetical protein [Flavitalea sp.]